MPKKLALLTQYFAPETGAPQNRLWEAAKGLQRKDWEVTVITALPNYPTGKIYKEYRGKLYHQENQEGLEVWRYWLYPSNSPKTLDRIFSMVSFSVSSLFSLFRLRKNRPDILIVESPPLTLGLTGLALSKLFGFKFIMNISDIWPLTAFELGSISKGRLYSMLERFEKYLYDHADACLGQSQQIVDHIQNVSSVKTHLFRNGVDFRRFSQEAKPVDKSGTFKVVYAGLLGVAQGIVAICKAVEFQKLGFEFHIYGDGPEREDLKAFLLNNPTRGVYYHGSVARDEIPATLEKNDIALVPLTKPIYGAVPSKVYEAMAAGLPIIFMGGGEGEELVAQNKAGWTCRPSDFEALHERLEAIREMSPEDLQNLKGHCKQVAKEVFDRRKQIAKLNVFLESFVDESRR